jgi:hypothetical protein
MRAERGGLAVLLAVLLTGCYRGTVVDIVQQYEIARPDSLLMVSVPFRERKLRYLMVEPTERGMESLLAKLMRARKPDLAEGGRLGDVTCNFYRFYRQGAPQGPWFADVFRLPRQDAMVAAWVAEDGALRKEWYLAVRFGSVVWGHRPMPVAKAAEYRPTKEEEVPLALLEEIDVSSFGMPAPEWLGTGADEEGEDQAAER